MRCPNCFMIYSEGDVCPHCGQHHSDEVAEQFYMKPGALLQEGRYYVGNVVGAGGFGITYAVWDNLLNRKVAIKEYLPGEFSTRLQNTQKITVYGGEKTEQFERGLEKFYEESLKLAKFNEVPGIVQIYDCFRENGTAYIVMEFLEGETLGERLKREEKLPVEESVQIITAVLDALEVVHKEGIIHRDIAPNNIFLCANGDVKILDFGAARKAAGAQSKSLTVLFKEGYTAEEQYRSRGEQGPWTDVYAVAATLYKMITGIVPESAMDRRRKDRLKAPGKLGVRIGANVEKAILNALNIDAKKRTRSALQFKEELCGDKRVANRFERTEEKKVAKIPVGLMVIIIVATLGIGTLIALFYTGVITFDLAAIDSASLGEGETRVINVVNMEEEEARAQLAGIGLELEVIELKYTNDVQAGRIISQQEAKGEVVEKGSVIHVVVSKGAATIKVPDLVNMDLESAKAALDELGLKYVEITVSSEEAPGYVIKHNPVKGKEIEQGQKVEVVVSGGKGYDTTQVSVLENLQGRNYKQVKDELDQVGVYLVVEGYEYRDDILKGGIISQDIPQDTQLHGEDVVKVVVSLGREVPEPADDFVIDWKDENLEKVMRAKTGVRTGDITYGDVKHITSLNLESREIKDISALGNLVNLEYLYLRNNEISDISALSNLMNLKELDLTNNSVSNLNALKELTDLEELTINNNNVRDISPLRDLTNLVWIGLQSNSVSDISALGNLTYLKYLHMGSNSVSDIRALSNLTNLTRLYLSYNNISNISALTTLVKLEELDLGSNNISDISAVGSLTNLKSLSIWENNITDISALSNLLNLTYLFLDANQISDISTLQNLTNLKSLSLHYNQISDISALSNLTNLGWLNLEGNPITDYSPVSHVPDVTY